MTYKFSINSTYFILAIFNFFSLSAQIDYKFNAEVMVESYLNAKYNYQTKEFVWKPSKKEIEDFGVSDDGYLYSKIHDIYSYGGNFKTIVIDTYIKNDEGYIYSCHSCSPFFGLLTFKVSKDNETTENIYFERLIGQYGEYGKPGKIGILQITNKDYCIKVDNSVYNTGTFEKTTYLYYEGKFVLEYITESSYEGSPSLSHSYKTNVKVDKINGVITLVKKGTEYNETKGKVIAVNKTLKYKFTEITKAWHRKGFVLLKSNK